MVLGDVRYVGMREVLQVVYEGVLDYALLLEVLAALDRFLGELDVHCVEQVVLVAHYSQLYHVLAHSVVV